MLFVSYLHFVSMYDDILKHIGAFPTWRMEPNFSLYVNHIVLLLQLRLEYLRKKKVTWIIEQPSSSLLPLYKPLQDPDFKACYACIRFANTWPHVWINHENIGVDQTSRGTFLFPALGHAWWKHRETQMHLVFSLNHKCSAASPYSPQIWTKHPWNIRGRGQCW